MPAGIYTQYASYAEVFAFGQKRPSGPIGATAGFHKGGAQGLSAFLESKTALLEAYPSHLK